MKLEKFETQQNMNGDEEKLNRLIKDFEDSLIISQRCLACLVALDAKPAADIECFFAKEKMFTEFISTLNNLDLNAYAHRNPEDTVAESFAEMFDDEELNQKFENPEIKARIFISAEERDLGKIKTICKGNNSSKYHRIYGNFLGFERENIEAFVYKMQPKWRKLIYRLRNSHPQNTINDYQAIQKYGQKLSEKEKQVFSAFTFQVMIDKKEMFEKTRENAKERRKMVEKSGLELETFLESLSDPRLQ